MRYFVPRRRGDHRQPPALQGLALARRVRHHAASSRNLQTLAEAIEHCRAKAAARIQIYRWVLFNVLAGNGDNHLKNLSFRVSARGIGVAPAYDLLCTAVYATKALARDKAHWLDVELALSVGEAKTFAQVRRTHLLAAGDTLGVSAQTAQLDAMIRNLPRQANRLLAAIEAVFDDELAKSPRPEQAKLHRAGELRLLRAIVRIVVPEMAARLAADIGSSAG